MPTTFRDIDISEALPGEYLYITRVNDLRSINGTFKGMWLQKDENGMPIAQHIFLSGVTFYENDDDDLRYWSHSTVLIVTDESPIEVSVERLSYDADC